MKRLEDIPFKATHVDMPQSFERRVQYALRRTKEEEHLRRFTLRTLLLAVLLVCVLAAETGAGIMQVTIIANGILDGQGELLPCSVGFEYDFQEDGTLIYTMEIDLEEPIAREEMTSYTLSVYLANQAMEVAPNGVNLEPVGERLSQDWTLEIQPQSSEA